MKVSVLVGGQMISDNTILAQEGLHYMKNCQYGPNRRAALKLNMSKAYDRVDGDFWRPLCERWVLRRSGLHGLWDACHR